MQIFYTPDIAGLEYTFSEDESKHAIRVLRMNLGDEIFLVDGKGKVYDLSDQKKPREFAGGKVKVTGTLKGNEIVVSSIVAGK